MSQAVVHGGLVYTAGQVDDSATDAGSQTAAILAKIDALLAEAGSSKAEVISANIWLANMADFAAMNAVWEGWILPNEPPARATVESKLAGPQYIVEIAVIAAIPG
jgi:enamine deaminase RidA (YjgF/YER057c/UK114 family)